MTDFLQNKIIEKERIGKLIVFILNEIDMHKDDAKDFFETTQTTFTNLEDGSVNTGIDLYISIAAVLGMRLKELLSVDDTGLNPNYRALLIQYHSFLNSGKSKFFEKPPTHGFAITSAAQRGFLEEFTTIKSIIILITDLFKYDRVPQIPEKFKKLLDSNILEKKSNKNPHEYRRGSAVTKFDPNKEYYVPTYIKLLLELKIKMNFDRLYLLSEILLKLSKQPLYELELIQFIVDTKNTDKDNTKKETDTIKKPTAAEKKDVLENYIDTLLTAKLITVTGKGKNMQCDITAKGRIVMNSV